MLKYVFVDLSPESMQQLTAWQLRVDAETVPRQRYEVASALFKNKTNATFREIKETLAKHAPGGDACYYCERDRYRDIEHIRPKRHYPQDCFSWKNYVFACTICNQDHKSDKFAVFSVNDEILEFDRSWDINLPVPVGAPVLLDIRHEDPLDFLMLDLQTGKFVPIGDEISIKRGKWTRELFDLNNEHLARIRIAAYRSFVCYLKEFQQAQNSADAARKLEEIRLLPHPTVLVEMRRQLDRWPKLATLFSNVPAEIGKRP